jgi:hypothetical protein
MANRVDFDPLTTSNSHEKTATDRPKWLLKANQMSLLGKELCILFALIGLVLKLFFGQRFPFEVNDVIKLCLFLLGAGLPVDISKVADAVRGHA